MKIGLLTFHDTTNYGALLHTYALQQSIKRLGADCEVINYQCREIQRRELPLRLADVRSIREAGSYLLSRPKQIAHIGISNTFIGSTFP